jgi:hypothetical protein
MCAPGRPSAQAAFHSPAGWVQINADGHFTFWIPATLAEENVQGTDSYVGRWTGPEMMVEFDYGMWSGGMDSRVSARPHQQAADNSGGRPGTIVTYADDDGQRITLLLVRHIDDTNNLTFAVTSAPQADKDAPLLVVKSVRFP